MRPAPSNTTRSEAEPHGDVGRRRKPMLLPDVSRGQITARVHALSLSVPDTDPAGLTIPDRLSG